MIILEKDFPLELRAISIVNIIIINEFKVTMKIVTLKILRKVLFHVLVVIDYFLITLVFTDL